MSQETSVVTPHQLPEKISTHKKTAKEILRLRLPWWLVEHPEGRYLPLDKTGIIVKVKRCL